MTNARDGNEGGPIPASGDNPDRGAGFKPPEGGAAPGASIDAPRLTPQNRADPDAEGEDATDPSGEGAKTGQSDKAEG